mmetsp:Transcript_17673/g.37203  ORF Transcript_17673/g.37203 Transcript_17673/m.37203 type:complete len:354 (+) Transcript_17673:112-1173(+)
MHPITNIPILLLACNTRRSFVITTCTSFVSVASISNIASPPANALDSITQNETGATSASSDLYLARPMGPSSKDGGNQITRPSAPIEYLLPATRVGVYIYQLLALTEELDALTQQTAQNEATADANKTTPSKNKTRRKLDDLFTNPPVFILSSDPSPSRKDPYNNLPPIVGELVTATQKQKQRQQNSISVGLAPQFFEVGELIGERRAWDRIVKAETARENASEVRRAFNIYTTNLNFNPEKYVYSGSAEKKKRMIREDKMPTAVDVIRSDLDARDLYRNVVQTKLEDAKAEYLFQAKQVGENNGDVDRFEVSELLSLLRDAATAADKWFSFIPDEDVETALSIVKKENRLSF